MDSKQCSLILQQTGVREDDNGQVYGQCYWTALCLTGGYQIEEDVGRQF